MITIGEEIVGKATYKDKLIAKLVAKPGLRSKVDANCIDCIYDPAEKGNWRQQVADCSCFMCPMHTVRAKSKGVVNE